MSTDNNETRFRIVEDESKFEEATARLVVEGSTMQEMTDEACKSFVLKEARKRGFPAYAITSLFPDVYPVDADGKEVVPVGTDGVGKVKAWRAVYEICTWR